MYFESPRRFGKKLSFPAILAIPLIGGALAVSWSAAETAQALVDTPAGASAIPVAGSESAPAAVQSAPAAVQKMTDEAEDATIAPTETSEVRRLFRLQEAALPPAEADRKSTRLNSSH